MTHQLPIDTRVYTERMPGGRSVTLEEGNRLREILRGMREKYPTQRELADALGASQQVVSHVLSGGPPGLGLVRRMGELLGKSVDELLRADADTGGANPRVQPLAGLPGWTVAEDAAREAYRFYPPEAWVGARTIMGATSMGGGAVTVETVRRAADLWLDLNRKAPDADSARDDELSRKHDEAEATKKAKQDAKPSVLDRKKK